MRFVMVPHGKKIEGEDVQKAPAEIGSNPPMTIAGKLAILENVLPKIKALGPYEEMFVSVSDRALGTASTLFPRLGIASFETDTRLTVFANLENGKVIEHPDHVGESYETWRPELEHFIAEQFEFYQGMPADRALLLISHRPKVAVIQAIAQGMEGVDVAKLDKMAKEFTGTHIVFETDDGKKLRIVA